MRSLSDMRLWPFLEKFLRGQAVDRPLTGTKVDPELIPCAVGVKA